MSNTEDRSERLFQLIRNDESQRNHFFDVLANTGNALPWLRPLFEGGYLSPKDNPPPNEIPTQKGYFTIPRWNVLGYLENVARQNAVNPEEATTRLIVSIIDSILDYRNEAGERIDNPTTDWVVVKMIFTLPVDGITEKHIQFVRTSLTSRWSATSLVGSELGTTAVPHLIELGAKDLLLALLNVILDYKKTDGAAEKYKPLVDEYWLNDMLEKNKDGIAELCSVQAAAIALDRIRSIVAIDPREFHAAMITTIEDHAQMHFPNDYQCRLVRFVRDMHSMSDPGQLRQSIVDLIGESHAIFKRIAVYTINEHYQELGDFLWSWPGNPLEEPWLKHEVYELLKAHCTSFTDEQLDTVLDWIENGKYNLGDAEDDETERQKTIAYYKREWVSALMATRDPRVLSLDARYAAVEPQDPEHPGFYFWMETRWGGNVAQIDKDELLKLSNHDLAKHLREFKPSGGLREPDRNDLSEAFRDCVSSKPDRFQTHLNPFLDIEPIYQYSLVRGLQEAWRAGKSFDWNGILSFIEKLISRQEFWQSQVDDGCDYRPAVAGQIAKLIEEGAKDDRHAFDETTLPATEDILVSLAKSMTFQTENDNGFVHLALNSPRGQVYSAMIACSLRRGRIAGNNSPTWAGAIRDFFEDLLAGRQTPTIDFYVTIGLHLPKLYSLDRRWISDRVNQIFPKTNSESWEAAFTGYLYSTNAVYTDLYTLLRENDHYSKALSTRFADSHCEQRLVGHICVGYLEGWETLEDKTSLMSQLVDGEDTGRLETIVHFFWGLRDDLTENIRFKVKPLWRRLVNTLSARQGARESDKVLSELSNWLSLVDSIDRDILGWVKLSTKYLGTETVPPSLVEYMLRHVSESPDEVGDILLTMLNAGTYPVHRREDIESIVRGLHALNRGAAALAICNSYMSRGFDFIKGAYETIIDRGQAG